MLRRILTSIALTLAMTGVGLGAGTADGATASPSAQQQTRAAAPAYTSDAKLLPHNNRMRKGCHQYRWSYRLTPPTKDWGLEVFLTDSRGDDVASGAALSGADPTKGTKKFRICSQTTIAGKFKITGNFLYRDGLTQTTTKVKPVKFFIRGRHHR